MGASRAIIIVHDVVLGPVLAVAIITILGMTMMLAIALTMMAMLAQMLIVSTVAFL